MRAGVGADYQGALVRPNGEAAVMCRILCLDDDATALESVDRILRALGHDVVRADAVIAALQALAATRVDLILSDYSMPGLTGLDFVSLVRDEGIDAPIIMLTGYASVEHAVCAMQAGVIDYLAKPYTQQQLELAVERGLELARLRNENARLRNEVKQLRPDHDLIGQSAAIRRVIEAVRVAAPTRATILLQGETGTGKELVARAAHEQSDRRAQPFVAINCAALPASLAESVFFGHEKGAFTGAATRHVGAFERAHGGTLLLDEVSEMKLDLQAKLLRVLQEQEVQRVGGSSPVRIDVRVIATTNRDLQAEVAAGRFRLDLFHRLNVFPIVVPPLRDRREDIHQLTVAFAVRTSDELGRASPEISPDALALLQQHDWPGNVRELKHVIERAVILSRDSVLHPNDFAGRQFGLAPLLGDRTVLRSHDHVRPNDSVYLLRTKTLRLADLSVAAIRAALDECGNNMTRAAAMLGITPRTLSSRMRSRRFRESLTAAH
jgi:DNA-binding NtrC family response regulator